MSHQKFNELFDVHDVLCDQIIGSPKVLESLKEIDDLITRIVDKEKDHRRALANKVKQSELLNNDLDETFRERQQKSKDMIEKEEEAQIRYMQLTQDCNTFQQELKQLTATLEEKKALFSDLFAQKEEELGNINSHIPETKKIVQMYRAATASNFIHTPQQETLKGTIFGYSDVIEFEIDPSVSDYDSINNMWDKIEGPSTM
eukprot:TRINITY_DN7739_c0_g1_i1.p1 TRINITY_DN7739_c0_g1~~TRINITY_DN7739_c0_g1_i1.p1  ORF type:complete len:202 (-),score=52.73 TRINITY_DN7739_c0_g1_i1:362-967(-)